MNREIKFRGKDIVSGEWHYGSYMPPFYEGKESFIWLKEDCFDHWEYVDHQVSTDTIGQYTGLKDKNGVEIYEGDVLYDIHGCLYGIVEWKEKGFDFGTRYKDCYDNIVCEIVGNIHDNPELIRKEEPK